MSSPCHCSTLRTATRKVSALYDAALAPLGINIAQYALLRIIARNERVSLTALGRGAELDRSTIGRNIRVLERMALVRTGRSEDDQRESVVSLAGRGAEILEQAAPLWEQCQREIEERLGAERLGLLRDILHAL